MSTTDDEVVDQALNATADSLPAALRARILDGVQAAAPIEQPAYHLAQFNIARFLLPMDHADMAGFVEMLDPINHLADACPGLVWRLTGADSNNAITVAYYDDPLMLVNMSVWIDVASLRDYVYRTEHAGMVKRKAEWANALESRHLVLWWIPAGHTPTVAEADARLALLNDRGPTADAFTFGQAFPPPPM